MSINTFSAQKKSDLSFVETHKRTDVDYANTKNPELLEAYRSGLYDAAINFIGELHLKITGTTQTKEEVKKFFRQTSFNSELTFKDNNGSAIKTESEQKHLIEYWFERNLNKSRYTQFILMI